MEVELFIATSAVVYEVELSVAVVAIVIKSAVEEPPLVGFELSRTPAKDLFFLLVALGALF